MHETAVAMCTQICEQICIRIWYTNMYTNMYKCADVYILHICVYGTTLNRMLNVMCKYA